MTNVYCGTNAAIIVNNSFSIIFLRYREDNIVSILEHSDMGKIGIVCGNGLNFNAHSEYCFFNPKSGITHYMKSKYLDKLEAHKKDTFTVKDKELTYTDYNGKIFKLLLAETLDDATVRTDKECDDLSTEDKMRIWNCGKKLDVHYSENDCFIQGEIITKKYATIFSVDTSNGFIYCRFGVHGYCEKGYAMRSTICLRNNECRMVPDNLTALEEFKPDEKYFVENSCAFPPDGSWYWSVKNSDEHTIYLNGCGDSTYAITKQ